MGDNLLVKLKITAMPATIATLMDSSTLETFLPPICFNPRYRGSCRTRGNRVSSIKN